MLTSVVLCFGCAPPDDGQDRALAELISGEAENGFAGVVYVERGGDVVIDAAYGEAGGVPLTTSSRFWIASAGKQFVSAGIMKLVDQGRIALDRSIADYLPSVPEDKQARSVRKYDRRTSRAMLPGLAARG